MFLIKVVSLLSWAAIAAPAADSINSYCVQGKAPAPLDSTSLFLEDIQTRYKNQDQRVKDPTGFVAELDMLIASSEFSYLLACRSMLPPPYQYRMLFQDVAQGDQSMEVDDLAELSPPTIQLQFNLTKSVQRVLFVYIHELTHVCQTPERINANIGDSIRIRMLGEIQAFFNMRQAYNSLLPLSIRLCRADGTSSDDANSRLYEAYVILEKQLAAGIFAQSTIQNYLEAYHEDYKSYEVNVDAELFDLKSPMHHYVDPVTKMTFQLHSLRPELKARIEQLGIPFNEP